MDDVIGNRTTTPPLDTPQDFRILNLPVVSDEGGIPCERGGVCGKLFHLSFSSLGVPHRVRSREVPLLEKCDQPGRSNRKLRLPVLFQGKPPEETPEKIVSLAHGGARGGRGGGAAGGPVRGAHRRARRGRPAGDAVRGGTGGADAGATEAGAGGGRGRHAGRGGARASDAGGARGAG
eukprot:CAMPEP_0174836288 /NCGR_PEP_ID=MMETSP1114-20130205/5964_1 /TAXON_ID=312471 /ORGANISM="Neobodo designis, Strain CCAP 1951/1" /LENGTH=177 /DNA_ID=CAMNT_0016070271 /DNA_START=141 /DNA_END=671 /DNA_ORIENTATION=-